MHIVGLQAAEKLLVSGVGSKLRGSKRKPNRVWMPAFMQATSPVYALAPRILDGWAPGGVHFKGISAAKALRTLRVMLGSLNVPVAGAWKYGTRTLRRGHAKGLQLSGPSLIQQAWPHPLTPLER